MLDSFIKFSDCPALRQAHIVDLGIPSYQVRVWSDLIGIGGPVGKMPSSKWRLYTPAEVFMISVMRLLKRNLNFAFSGREKYIQKLISPIVIRTALNAFCNKSDCFIISDYTSSFEVVSETDAIQFAVCESDLSLVIPTSLHIRTMLQASSRSQNDIQMNTSLMLLKHYQSSSNSPRTHAPHHRVSSRKGRSI